MPDEAMAAAADLDPSDPYARKAQVFPRLGPEMATRIAAYGTEEDLAASTLVFQRSRRSVDFFFVQSGSIEISDLDDQGAPSRVVRIKCADFRRLASGEPDIGEIMMRAFILRRVGLILHT